MLLRSTEQNVKFGKKTKKNYSELCLFVIKLKLSNVEFRCHGPNGTKNIGNQVPGASHFKFFFTDLILI